MKFITNIVKNKTFLSLAFVILGSFILHNLVKYNKYYLEHFHNKVRCGRYNKRACLKRSKQCAWNANIKQCSKRCIAHDKQNCFNNLDKCLWYKNTEQCLNKRRCDRNINKDKCKNDIYCQWLPQEKKCEFKPLVK
jgi:hypothetical protein